MQAQIQALLVAAGGVGGKREAVESNTGSHMEVAKPAIFSREAGRVGGLSRLVVGVNLCAGRVSGCLERKHDG